jgi:hypothetical protein
VNLAMTVVMATPSSTELKVDSEGKGKSLWSRKTPSVPPDTGHVRLGKKLYAGIVPDQIVMPMVAVYI